MKPAHPLLPYWEDRRPDARATMFCLPHAGGGASAYRDWVRASATLDVQPVQLPGREQLIGMPGIDQMPELVSLIAELIISVAPETFVLFGHSMGGAIAAEVAARLDRDGFRRPALLVVSARPPMNQIQPEPAESDDEQLVRRVLGMGGTPAGLLEDPELRELFLSTIRTDMRLLHGYAPTLDRLSVPLLALGGTEDDVTESRLAAWQAHFAAPIHIQMFPGDHFYLRHHRDAVLAAVQEAVARSLAGRKPVHGP